VDFPLRPNRLEALCARRLGDDLFVRAARFYAWGTAVLYGSLLVYDPGDPNGLLVRAVGTLAWIVGGVVGLAAAHDPASSELDGLLALARQRGFGAGELSLARFTTAARRITAATAGPALLVSLAPLVHVESVREAGSCFVRSLGVLAFAASLGLTVAGLARAGALTAPGRGRAALIGIVLLPYALNALSPEVPSVPSLLGSWLGWLTTRGGA
jgi:hypothetical protein